MEKIEKLYQPIKNLQELGLSLPEDVLKKITDLMRVFQAMRTINLKIN